ncbi:MAG TPA: hypothetical protein VFR05_03885 [Terriglobia bacterium]|nr:hypothetical protein [Terriglobia bacterium]
MSTLFRWIGTGALIALSTFHTAAQSISGPSLGFVSNEDGTRIWPLLGILGASVPGRPLELPEGITQATLSPQQDYAIAVATSNSQPVIVYLDSSSPTIAPLAGGRSNPSLFAISPTGSAAALYEKGSRMLQLVSGLPAAPQIGAEIDISSLGDIHDIAVSDDAKLALVNAGSDIRTLSVVQENGSTSPVSGTQPSRMTFISGRPDAVIADDAAQEVFVLQGLDQNPVRAPGIVFRDSAREFSAVGASRDARWIFVAQRDSEDISILDLETRAVRVVPCHCKPTTFFPMKGVSVFRLNGFSNGPITVLDASSSNPRTLIIPMDPNQLGDAVEQ